MKAAKLMLLLLLAVFLGGKAVAKLSVNSKDVTSADVTVAVGETATVKILNDSTRSSYTLSLAPSSSSYYETSPATLTVPKASGSTLGSVTMTIKGLKATTAVQTITVTAESSWGSWGTSSVTIKLTVTDDGGEPDSGTTFVFDGCTVAVTNATVSYAGGEPVLTFRKAGTLYVSGDMRADILVVGGGGSGAAGRKGNSNWYAGAGGNGGNGSVGTYEMPQGAYAIVVGAGGAGVTVSGNSNVAAGNAGGASSVELKAGGGSFETVTGLGGSGGANTAYKNKDSPSGGSGNCPASDIAGGSAVQYGTGGAGCTYSGKVSVTGASGAVGTGDGGGGGANGGGSGAGGGGVVIVRLKEAVAPCEPVEKPTAATGLVYDGTVQTGVATDVRYTLGGTPAAKDVGSYEATVTPAKGYCWTDGTYGTVRLAWSIMRRSVTVSVVPTGKTEGEEEPAYETRAEGFVAGDATETEVTWKVWRTNLVEQADGSLGLNEAVGVYDLVVSGTEQTANYSITYVNGAGAFEIRAAGPSISDDDGTVDYDSGSREVVVTPAEGVRDVEIVNMPDDATARVPVSVDTIRGVTPNQVVVAAEATNETGTVRVDITDAFRIAETPAGVTITLSDDPEAAVEVVIGGRKETVRVTPELTEPGDAAVEPLTVGEGNVGLGAKTIPGLTYHLKRSTALGGESETVASETAKGTRTKLTDPMAGEKPSRAFYVIEVTK